MPGAERTRPAERQRAPGSGGRPEGLADGGLGGQGGHLGADRAKLSGELASRGLGRVPVGGQRRLPGIVQRRLPLVDDVHRRHGHEQHDQARHVSPQRNLLPHTIPAAAG